MTSAFTHPLLDRYLSAVGVLLPLAERDDILRELRANLEARLEAIADSKGRDPSEDEVCAILKEHGHPVVVAARYRPQDSLIGPLAWPYFWAGLKVVGILAAVGAVADAVIVTLLANNAAAWAGFLPRLLLSSFKIGLPAFGVWVIVMAVVERGWLRSSKPLSWDPRLLKKDGAENAAHAWADGIAAGVASFASVFGGEKCTRPERASGEANAREESGSPFYRKDDFEYWKARRNKNRRGRAFSAFFGAIVNAVAWFALFHYGDTFFRPLHFNVAAGPVWADNYATILGLFVLQCLVLFPPVVNPQSAALRHASKALSHVIGATVVLLFLNQPPLFVTTPLAAGQVDLTTVVNAITEWQHTVLLVCLLIAAAQALYRVGRFAAVFLKE